MRSPSLYFLNHCFQHIPQIIFVKYVKINKNEFGTYKKLLKVLTFLSIGLLYNYNWL